RAVADDHLDRRRAVGIVRPHRVGADVALAERGLARVDAEPGGDGRVVAVSPRVEAHPRRWRRHSEGVGVADLTDLAVDPIEAEAASLAAESVEPREVPAPALVVEAVRLDGAELAVV